MSVQTEAIVVSVEEYDVRESLPGLVDDGEILDVSGFSPVRYRATVNSRTIVTILGRRVWSSPWVREEVLVR